MFNILIQAFITKTSS